MAEADWARDVSDVKVVKSRVAMSLVIGREGGGESIEGSMISPETKWAGKVEGESLNSLKPSSQNSTPA